MKKETAWDLTNPMTGNDATAGTTPKKATPRKRAPNGSAKKNMAASVEDGDDEEASFEETPTKKKSTLNKTQGGRVTKPRANGRAKVTNYADPETPDEDEDEADLAAVKMEHHNPFSSNGNGLSQESNGFQNGNNNSSFYADGDEEYI